MTNSNNFFQMMEELRQYIDWLNQILIGGEQDTVTVGGVIKPSVSKDIADKWSAIQAMVQGRQAYETRASLPVFPPENIVLAEVWRDSKPENNGLYGWTGTIWEKSPYDVSLLANALFDKAEFRVDELGLENVNKNTSNTEFAVTDRNGRQAIGVRSNGAVEFSGLLTELAGNSGDLLFMNQFNQILLQLLADGTIEIPGLKLEKLGFDDIELTVNRLIEPKDLNLPPLSELTQLIMYGQSLSVGAEGEPAISIQDSPVDYMFSHGAYVESNTIPEFYPLMPYKEGTANRNRETPQAGVLQMIHDLCDRENGGLQLAFLMGGAGRSSTKIEELSKGTVNFARFEQMVLNGQEAAKRDGRGTSLAGVFWVQGENDLGNPDSEAYVTQLLKLRKDMQAIRSGNQAANLPMFSYQTAPALYRTDDRMWGVPNAQMLASELDPLIFIATPTYWMDFVADEIHMPNYSYKLLGAYLGKAWKRVMVDGIKWKPLSPVSFSYSGNSVDIKLHVPNKGLVIEPGESHAGFRLKDLNGEAVIQSVEIVNDNAIRIKADRTLSSPLQISYARFHDGCVRDTASEHEYINIDGVVHPLHNYLVAFMKEI
ncbi:sialate O-acetylesterase [Vibrio parahaemolyticus]|uniref:sialate O-acetylesterase n=1 Tax=Vibrio parahaemolyticus TaxID=670 RepID=UPI00226A096C|nr:sialate O-acetylesterase [Vibrio parahaemolyticus]MCX8892222.1 sialate O-acetylesterase [Vibrio parahaemolyticus]